MKRYLVLLSFIALAMLSGCQKKWETEIELGVNNTRINIPWANAQDNYDFTFPVYSNGDWTIRHAEGGDWLSLGMESGSGTKYVPVHTLPNILTNPRVVRVEVKGSGKTIQVYFVISSETVKAEDIDDALLDSYLY